MCAHGFWFWRVFVCGLVKLGLDGSKPLQLFAIDGRRQYPSKKQYLEKIWCKYNTIPIVVKLFPFFLPLPIVPWHHGEIIMFLQDGAPGKRSSREPKRLKKVAEIDWVYGRYNERVLTGFINQHSHHWRAPSCIELMVTITKTIVVS